MLTGEGSEDIEQWAKSSGEDFIQPCCWHYREQ